MEHVASGQGQASGPMDPTKSHFDDLLVRRVAVVIEAIDAAHSSIRKCRQQRIEAYLVRKDVHSSVCRLRSEVARARLLTLTSVRQPK
jgi:hypothetical protein